MSRASGTDGSLEVLCPGRSSMLYQDGSIKVEEPVQGCDRHSLIETKKGRHPPASAPTLDAVLSGSHGLISMTQSWFGDSDKPALGALQSWSPMVREVTRLPSSSHLVVVDSVRSMTHLL